MEDLNKVKLIDDNKKEIIDYITVNDFSMLSLGNALILKLLQQPKAINQFTDKNKIEIYDVLKSKTSFFDEFDSNGVKPCVDNTITNQKTVKYDMKLAPKKYLSVLTLKDLKQFWLDKLYKYTNTLTSISGTTTTRFNTKYDDNRISGFAVTLYDCNINTDNKTISFSDIYCCQPVLNDIVSLLKKFESGTKSEWLVKFPIVLYLK